jgi:Glycosyl hydrolases family 25
MLEGIDVSRWQTTTPPLVGRSFLLAKASEGRTLDPMFATHVANARHAGLVVGAYHFSREDVPIAAQVATFLEAAAGAGVTWLAFDVEGQHAWSRSQIAMAIDQVHKAGHRIGLYMSEGAFVDAGQDWSWVANWSHQPGRAWDVWQYRGSPLDLDRFGGTIDELRALAGGSTTMAQLPITDKTPHTVDIAAPMTFYDLDGSVLSEGHGAVTGAYSPYVAMNGSSTFYAIYAGPPPYRLILTKPAAVHDIPPADCSAEIAADRAKAKVAVVYEEDPA